MSSLPLLLLPLLAAAAPAPGLPRGWLQVPLVVQSTPYSCGPAALLAVLRYWQAYKGGETELHELLATSPEEGTHPKSLKNVAEAYGLSARFEENLDLKDLLRALRKGETVILDIQAWREPGSAADWEQAWENGHYVVLVGRDSRHVYVMDPSLSGSYGYIPVKELPSRWHDYHIEGGKRREYRNAAVIVSGKTPLKNTLLQRVE